MPKTKYRYKNLLMTPEDERIAKFIHKRLGGTLSFAMKEAMRRYARQCGYKTKEIDDKGR